MENIKKPKVSVIVPIYNRENVIEPCARSLFEQSLNDIEYIYVDDGSKDRSVEVLKNILDNYPKRKTWVKIICQPDNKGVAVARRIGIEHATGEYIIHCDTDDWVDIDAGSQKGRGGLEYAIKFCDAQHDMHGHGHTK